jgi:hypothetical protein
MQRRRLIAAPLALAPLPAAAFRAEPLVGEAAAAYAEGCARSDWHAALRDELARQLDGRPLPEPLREELDRLATCRFCGCRVVDGPLEPPTG